MSARPRNAWRDPEPERLEARIVIERDGTIVVRSGKIEYGQGIRTGFARIVAEELDVPVDRVRVVLGETDSVPWDMGTFGSMSTAVDGPRVRAAAARARAVLLDRAAARLGCAPDELSTREGTIVGRDGRSVRYEELTANQPLAGDIPADAPGVRRARHASDIPMRLDAHDIVTGRARFVADVRLPGMLRARVLHPPSTGAQLTHLDDGAARAIPGVIAVVREGHFVGVVAERDEQAAAALAALRADWTLPRSDAQAGTTRLTLRRDEQVDAAFGSAVEMLDAHYDIPHIAHASIGPSAAVADVRTGDATLYVTTQRPFGVRDEVAQLLGIAPERVHVHPQTMSGVYGRGNMNDAASEAARLSRAVQRPVLLQWTREDEFRASPHRPRLDAQLSAALGPDGAIAGWRSRVVTNFHTYGGTALPPRVLEMTSGRNAVPPYALGAAEVVVDVVPGEIRTGAFRSLAAAPNVFATESFVDEIAHATGQDPIAFRLTHIRDQRLRRVLEAVRDRSGWATRGRERGRGFGVACALYHGTYIAEVVELTVASGGRVRLEHVWCAVDAGRLVHPDGARNQIEGGVQQAASWTLLEALGVEHGAVTTTTWREYPIATFHDAPRAIDVAFVGDAAADSTGTGEPGSVPTAAAIANAVFEACAIRVRRLPLSPPLG